jgi:hypothetical protein
MNNLRNLPPRLEFFARLGECLDAGDESDFIRLQTTLFGSSNSDFGQVKGGVSRDGSNDARLVAIFLPDDGYVDSVQASV